MTSNVSRRVRTPSATHSPCALRVATSHIGTSSDPQSQRMDARVRAPVLTTR